MFHKHVLKPEPSVYVKLSCPLKIIIETSKTSTSMWSFLNYFLLISYVQAYAKTKEDQVIIAGVSGEKMGHEKNKNLLGMENRIEWNCLLKISGLVVLVPF